MTTTANRWQIEIGVTTRGELLIGAQSVTAARVEGRLAASEVVYSSQLECRCAVRCPFPPPAGSWCIMRRRYARIMFRDGEADAILNFPKADPAYSRKRKGGTIHVRTETA